MVNFWVVFNADPAVVRAFFRTQADAEVWRDAFAPGESVAPCTVPSYVFINQTTIALT